jgi:hypothetical protein
MQLRGEVFQRPRIDGATAAEMTAHTLPIAGKVAPRFPHAAELSFSSFNNKYAGQSCHVVGRGPTLFNYEELARVDEPIFFINDAVCLEKYAQTETFFFAHDARMLAWLNGAMRSTAVLPIGGNLFLDPYSVLAHAGAIVFYRWVMGNRLELLQKSRDEIAASKQLYTQTGTIHSLIHFVWFCGFKRVTFIGCDGIDKHDLPRCRVPSANGYDVRLQNLSRSSPWWHYTIIRNTQDRLTAQLGLESIYYGTPSSVARRPA